MKEHSIPVANLVFPVLLPLAQRALLKQAVCLNDQPRCGGLEAYASLYAYDGVADVAVAAYGVAGADFFYLLYGLYLVVIVLAVYGVYLAFL